eukprot:CAMPEP_0198213488 /NCGR_PEP_ID=MMETSP1445-20131203/28896_1 /TAXON_ID=36898 /ORGANISM="Pyramimonas sp., Strain CCMP2087" /LENGTH=369 /DNA_ID=CAMNT_0043888141 /DNA_START=305 /DNA_END=1414 /DNA_ORIENTATION=+
MSETHQQQMMVFGAAPARVIEGYSDIFLETFMKHMKVSHAHSRIAATVVYNEFISDKHHIHMNSTKWESLTEFVQMLGKEGLCKVEDTPKGWFVTLIDRDPFEEIEQKKRVKRERAEEDESSRRDKEVNEQVERAHQKARTDQEGAPILAPSSTDLKRDNPEEKLAFGLAAGNPRLMKKGLVEASERAAIPSVFGAFSDDNNPDAGRGSHTSSSGKKSGGGGSNAMEAIIEEEQRRERVAEARREKELRQENWLHEGIVVKVMSKALQGAGHYKQKGVVQKVIDKFIAQIKMLESGNKVRVDQAELETVIPNVGGTVLIVNGGYRGQTASLVSVDVKNFSAKLRIKGGASNKKELSLPYEDICKFSSYA